MPPYSEITYREVSPWDAQELGYFFKRNDAYITTRTFKAFSLNQESADRIALHPRRDLYYLAYLNNQLVGLSLLRGWDEGYEIPSFGIMIDSCFRGKGVGRQLTVWTLETARQKGCQKVRLTVYGTNRAGVALYESLGFVRQSETPTLVEGEADTTIVMMKIFNQKDKS